LPRQAPRRRDAEAPRGPWREEVARAGRASSDITTFVLPILAALAALVVYSITLHPSIPGGDSGELIAVASCAGVAHPPGYPLYTLLGFAWMHVVPFGAIAWRMNLLSAVTAAGAVGIVAWTVRRFTHSAAAALAGALALAFSTPFWKNAVVAEVFALNALLAAMVLAAAVMILECTGLLDPPSAGGGSRPQSRSGMDRQADRAMLGTRGVAGISAGPIAGSKANAGPTPACSVLPFAALALVSTLLISHHHTLVLIALPVDAFVVAMFVVPERTWHRAGRTRHSTTKPPPSTRSSSSPRKPEGFTSSPTVRRPTWERDSPTPTTAERSVVWQTRVRRTSIVVSLPVRC